VKIKTLFVFSLLYCLLFKLLNRNSMFVVLHSDINSLKSGLLQLTWPGLIAKRVDKQKSKIEL
jgi:hypothetical protein